MNSSLIFTKENTLSFLSLAGHDIIYPLMQKGDNFRGGVFWCIPNFDIHENIFLLRHGEYRKTVGVQSGETTLKNLAGTWGYLHTETLWKRSETALNTSIFLKAKKDETFLRPGIHPYFVTKNLVKIIYGDNIYTTSSERYDPFLILSSNTRQSICLVYTTYTLHVSWHMITNRNMASRVILWTDNISEYICVEICFGKSTPESLPLPITLQKNETISLSYELKTSKTLT